MMTAIKKSQIVAATVAVIAMSAVATPSHARTVKAAAKTRVAPKTTTIVNQHIDGTSDTVMVRPNGFTIVDGMPFYPTQIVTTPTYRTVSTSTPVVTTTAPVVTTAPITTLPSTTVVSTSNVNTTTPVTVQTGSGATVTVSKPATVVSTTTTTPVLLPASTPAIATMTTVPVTPAPAIIVNP
ncbi:hypothetical protein E6P72_03010 [Moraxella osloensis]|nr:hypothetical protein [Moraxella osloensis]MDI4480063.1 hypothetical protein [Moraxella osloensis]